MQQVNLYLPEFRPNREPFRALHMLWALLALIVLLALLSVSGERSNGELEQQLLQSQQQLDGLRQQVDMLTRARPQVSLESLDSQIVQLNEKIERRQRLLTLVESNNLGNSNGFSAQLTAMARQHLDSLALEAFSFSRGGHYLELIGEARSAEQIPMYLQRLRSESAFQDTAFGVLHINAASTGAGILSFSLAAQAKADAPTAESKTAVEQLLDVRKREQGGRP